MWFEINDRNEFLEKSDWPIELDWQLSQEEIHLLNIALEWEEKSLYPMLTSEALSDFLHNDVMPYILDTSIISEFSDDVKEDLQNLAHKYTSAEEESKEEEKEKKIEKEVSIPKWSERWIKERNKKLEEEWKFTLSQEKFEECFPIDSDIKQSNYGNCYMVSSIEALQNFPHFEPIIRQSVKRDWENWKIRIPFITGSYITVTPKDLESKENPNFWKTKPLSWGKTDSRKKLNPLDWAIWFQILEAAHIIKEYGKVTWESKIKTEGGWMDEALGLYWGDLFKHETISAGSEYNNQTGKTKPKALSRNHHMHELAVSMFNNYNPNIHIITFAKFDPDSKSIGWFDQTFWNTAKYVQNHAYTVTDFDTATKKVKFNNPWDTWKEYSIDLMAFLDIYSTIKFTRVDHNKLMSPWKQNRDNQNIAKNDDYIIKDNNFGKIT